MVFVSNRLPAIVLFLISFLVPTGIQAKDSLAWMEAVAPPFFIHEGELKRQGYEDLITDILVTNLPQYQHKRQQATISRHYQQWKQGGKRLQRRHV